MIHELSSSGIQSRWLIIIHHINYFILWRYVRSFCKIWSLSHLSFMGFAMIYQCNSVMYIAHTHTLQSSMQQLLSQRQKILRPFLTVKGFHMTRIAHAKGFHEKVNLYHRQSTPLKYFRGELNKANIVPLQQLFVDSLRGRFYMQRFSYVKNNL